MKLSGNQENVLFFDTEHEASFDLDDNANLSLTLVCVGDAKVNLTISMASHCTLEVNTLLLGRSQAEVRVEHLGPHSSSKVTSKNIVKEIASFKAKTVIAESASDSKAKQKIESILIDPKAKVVALPILDIKNNDVECGHGATVGSIDEQTLFYLRSRGLTCKQAQQAIIDGHIEPFLAKLNKDQQKRVVV